MSYPNQERGCAGKGGTRELREITERVETRDVIQATMPWRDGSEYLKRENAQAGPRTAEGEGGGYL